MIVNLSQSTFIQKLLNEELIDKIEGLDSEILNPTEKFMKWLDDEEIIHSFEKEYTRSRFLSYHNVKIEINLYDLLLEVDENDLTKILLRWA